MTSGFLPYGRQSIDPADIDAVTDVLRSGWLTTGPAVERFETAFSQTLEGANAVSCSNGTAALHLALAGLGIGPGDQVIVPAITFAATANAALYCGARVVFADVDPLTGLMRPVDLAEALERADGPVRAVMPVHLAGQCQDMAALAAQARAAGASCVEDACHALGSMQGDRPVGACAHSDAACFSFHPVKTIAAGEGGMVTTRDPDLARRMSQLRSHGVEREPDRFRGNAAEPWRQEMQALGWNYRLSDIHAALALSQLARLDIFRVRRQALADHYDACLADQNRIGALVRTQPAAQTCLHLYPVRIDFADLGTDRTAVMTALRARGIGSQVHYIPVPDMPYYAETFGTQAPPGAARYYANTLSLPLYSDMELSDVERVVDSLNSVLDELT
ncbi:UDP-4-amino-4,6-dideoxy-N-acetyl-beta-L-altrosamine transaminase [Maricaulis sp. D1M11]|uniref:UDP-4-amino-4, 6-dideoxy-N-acetyl-beta-L-altrosamine transaminase n=1 Tax=Maricaulis sp. D1M11 TaxID=3076117 RepID=UPI0039B52FE7